MPLKLVKNQSDLVRDQDFYLFLFNFWRLDSASYIAREGLVFDGALQRLV